MLSLSKKFFNQTDYLSDGYKIAFNPTKNKLTFYKAEKADKSITDLQQITKHINELKKPVFTEITPYRNCHKKIKAINQSIDREKGIVINLESFNENFKPTSAELKEQIWAVHATNILPKDTITPVVSNALTEEIILGVTNTTHFALGELVRPHEDGSWEDRPFAVITPLSSIIDQAVNIFAQDTFITGKWKLKKETIVLVPEGTDVSELKDKSFSIIPYKSPQKNLRAAVDEVIQKKGLSFKMGGNTPALGCKSFLDEDININTVSFFENLLKEKQGMLSFGDHTHSQVGDAALFGMIRQLMAELISITSHPNPFLKIFYKPSLYMDYHLVKFFYNKIKDKYFSQEEQQNIEKLLSIQEKEIPDRQNIKDPLWPVLIPEYFGNMNQIEMHEFKAKYPDLFDGQKNEFEAAWAISRWFSIGYNQGLEEGLNKVINTEIEQFVKIDPQSFYLLFTPRTLDLLTLHNSRHSDRLPIVNEILELKAFKAYKDALESHTAESEMEKLIQQLLTNFSITT